MQDTATDTEWTEVIKPKRNLLDFHFKEIWRYRDLLFLLVRRDFVAAYKQTILGPLWHVLQPIFTTITFTVIFANVAGISTDGVPAPLFYFTGTLIWGFFSKCIQSTSGVFVGNQQIFSKVYFPRMIVPLSTIVTAFIAFLIQSIILIAMYIYYYCQGADIHLNAWAFSIPLMCLIMGVMGLAMGIIISSVTTKYRDLSMFVGFGIQLLMYCTPIIYPVSFIPEKYRFLLLFNPLAPVVEGFKYSILGVGTFNANMLLYSIGVTIVLLFIGLILFNKVEQKFIDTV